MGGGGAAVPAVAVQAADQAAQTMAALANASQNATTSGGARCTSAACRTGCPRRGSLHQPARLAWIGAGSPGWRSRPPCHARPGPAGRAGSRSRLQVHHRLGGQRPDHLRCPTWPPAARRRALAGAGTRPRDAPASVATERFRPCLRRSTGLGPASAAAGRLGGAPIHRQVLELQAEQLVIGGSTATGPVGNPSAIHSSRRRRAWSPSRWVGDAAVAAAEHQDLDELVEHDPVSDAGAVAAERVVDLRVGSRAATWTHSGSRIDDGRAGTSLQMTQGVEPGDHHGSCLPCSTPLLAQALM